MLIQQKNPSLGIVNGILDKALTSEEINPIIGKITDLPDDDGNNPAPPPYEPRGEILTDEDKRKLNRYDNLEVEDLPDDWKEQHKKLLDRINDLELNLPDDWDDKLKELENNQDKLKSVLGLLPTDDLPADWDNLLTRKSDLDDWTNTFPGESADDVKKRLDNSTGTIDPDQQQKLDDYDNIKAELDKLKDVDANNTKLSDENSKLKNQLILKQAEVDKLKGWKQQPKPSTLIDEINQKIIQAYNSHDYLGGYYENLMKTFLSWEFSENDERKKAVIKLRPSINKCLTYLEKVSEVRNSNNPL